MHAEYWSGDLLGTVRLKRMGGLKRKMGCKEVCIMRQTVPSQHLV
jgi:hypothetical protein